MRTPVLLMVFNRPKMALQVFEKIRQIRPPKLFIICDGPRPNRENEVEKVMQCRAIKDLVDWKCEVHVNFAEVNMGCKNRVASGITWAFQHVEDLIILEDDCVPDLTFFRFCQELLEKYRYDTRIMSISGFNDDVCEYFNESYGFAKQFECWGWATWKRAWDLFDINMELWPEFRKNDAAFKNILRKNSRKYLEREFQAAYENRINSWAYRFYFSSLMNNGLHIMPKFNMVRNIGFGAEGGTHTAQAVRVHLHFNEPAEFPLIHPRIIAPIDRFFKTSDEPDIGQIERLSKKYYDTLRELFRHKQYHAMIMLFKDIVYNRDTFVDPNSSFLTNYHRSYLYYVAAAYFNLRDYENAIAALEVLLSSVPQYVNGLVLLAHSFIALKKFNEANEILSRMEGIELSEQQKDVFNNLKNLLSNQIQN